MVDIDNYVIYY